MILNEFFNLVNNKGNFMKYVLGFALTKNKNKVLMIQKNRPSFQKGLFNGIGGKIEEFDANSLNALIREFQEETSLITKQNDWFFLDEINGKDFSIDCYYGFFEEEFLKNFKTLTDETVYLLDFENLKTQSYRNCVYNVDSLLNLII
jgi:8-oxo-dGTP diphosphatase